MNSSQSSESQLSNMILESVVVKAHCSSLLAVTKSFWRDFRSSIVTVGGLSIPEAVGTGEGSLIGFLPFANDALLLFLTRSACVVGETANFLQLTYSVTAQAINKPVSSWLTASTWSESPSRPSGFPPALTRLFSSSSFLHGFLSCYINGGGGSSEPSLGPTELFPCRRKL